MTDISIRLVCTDIIKRTDVEHFNINDIPGPDGISPPRRRFNQIFALPILQVTDCWKSERNSQRNFDIYRQLRVAVP